MLTVVATPQLIDILSFFFFAESYGKKMLNAALNKAKTDDRMYYISPTIILVIVLLPYLLVG